MAEKPLIVENTNPLWGCGVSNLKPSACHKRFSTALSDKHEIFAAESTLGHEICPDFGARVPNRAYL
jgi:hypothetical protein